MTFESLIQHLADSVWEGDHLTDEEAEIVANATQKTDAMREYTRKTDAMREYAEAMGWPVYEMEAL